MTTEEILSNNKLIADFMGATYVNYGDGSKGVLLPDNPFSFSGNGVFHNGLKDLKYHKSYDWLMQVVDKIEGIVGPNDKTLYFIEIGSTNSSLTTLDSNTSVRDGWFGAAGYGETRLEGLYNLIIRFINWFNKRNGK